MGRLIKPIVIASLVATAGAAIAAHPFPGQKLKKPVLISHYAARDVECWSGGTSVVKARAKEGFTVFHYAEDARRLWIDIRGTDLNADILLGMDATCTFTGERSKDTD